MNQFEISVVKSKNEDGTPFNEVRLLIDGRDLIAMLKEFEKPMAKRGGSGSIAGAYSGLSASHTPKERFLGICDKDYGDSEDKVAVLECDCGCEGCWPFVVKIAILDSTVIWNDFEQPHRGTDSVQVPWDYSGFGPFEFERNQYEQEINKLDGYALKGTLDKQ